MEKGSRLEFALVGLLKQGPKSGYDLRKMFSTTPMRHFSDSPGSIYPALKRMQERGWIKAESEDGNARKRREFEVTAEGARVFVEWLREKVGRDDVIWRSDDLILRFAFMDGNISRPETLMFLEQWEREMEEYIRELKSYFSNIGPEIRGSTGGLAFEYGIEGYEAQLAWARRAHKLLAEAIV